MSFFRHREIYRSDVIRLVRERRKRRPRPHRLDEFPVGYSSADCSPAGSASASPTADHSALKSSCRSILFHRTANSVLTVCLSQRDHPSSGLYIPPDRIPSSLSKERTIESKIFIRFQTTAPADGGTKGEPCEQRCRRHLSAGNDVPGICRLAACDRCPSCAGWSHASHVRAPGHG